MKAMSPKALELVGSERKREGDSQVHRMRKILTQGDIFWKKLMISVIHNGLSWLYDMGI